MEDEQKGENAEPARNTESDASEDDQLYENLLEGYQLGDDLPWDDLPQEETWQEDEESAQRRAAMAKSVRAFAKSVFAEQFRIRWLRDRIMLTLGGSLAVDMEQIDRLLGEVQSSFDGIRRRAAEWDLRLSSPRWLGSNITILVKQVHMLSGDIDEEAFAADGLIRRNQELEAVLSGIFLRDEQKRLAHFCIGDPDDNVSAVQHPTDFADTAKELRSAMTRLGEVSSMLEEYMRNI